jgi:hypothetical protein
MVLYASYFISIVNRGDLNICISTQPTGNPFLMHNLITIKADGAAADAAYGRIVLPALLRHAAYPFVLLKRSHSSVINSAGERADFFEKVAIVRLEVGQDTVHFSKNMLSLRFLPVIRRYRCRRDFLDIFTSAALIKGIEFKFQSIEQTVATPMTPIIFIDARFIMALLLLSIGYLTSLCSTRSEKVMPQKKKKIERGS